MVNSSTSQPASPSILANLLEANATLATQEAELTTQLAAVREKRQSLQTVIDLFTTSSPTLTSSQVGEDTAAPADVPTEDAASASDTSVPTPVPAAEEPEEVKLKQSRSTSKPPATAKSSKAPQGTKAGKLGKRSNNWQDYLQPAFRQTSLPTAIAAVFQRRPEELLSVPDLVDEIFVEAIPQDVRTIARNRMLNILSTGAKEGQWYRGPKGRYSLSQKVAESSR
ncbi:hypothetical protein H6F90_27785 [Trichocoleus sp. FACHB-591]|uniref:hypothetical protein n=1 Tax=Trichocoleus sp. FACHB-591 TaxID=2692872 RepID=UPI0016832E5D|nr:hypothetical protein [Trichocoleus sp. FACHB-591]MBD2098868.1 hypothetical protein [Trichocoleus sp. FACHB-591]